REHAVEQVVEAREVPVQRCGHRVRLLRDARHRERLVRLALEQLDGRVEDRPARQPRRTSAAWRVVRRALRGRCVARAHSAFASVTGKGWSGSSPRRAMRQPVTPRTTWSVMRADTTIFGSPMATPATKLIR